MARMIPSHIDPSVKSSAERKIFEWFENDKETADWIILHSLGLSEHTKLIFGEIDFLVIAPKFGIFVLEVKGGRIQRTSEGVWIYTDRRGKENSKERGPFDQAKEGMFSLLNYLKEHNVGDNWLYGYGVMFPDIEFEEQGPDFDKEQIFSAKDEKNVGRYIKKLAKYFQDKWNKKYPYQQLQKKILDSKEAKKLAKLLRGEFDLPVTLKAQLVAGESETLRFTEEQYTFLDALEDNPRCMLVGPAGTGKTMLALEDVKRSIIAKKKVALFCCNANLGNWLKNQFSLQDDIYPDFVGTFHSYMCKIAGISGNTLDTSWADLPVKAMCSLPQSYIKFDKIIIDEIQDLINEEYLDLLDTLLDKGLERGCWTFLGDFRNQAIYSDYTSEQLIEMVEKKSPAFVKLRLKNNCRNTKNIGKVVQKIAKMTDNEYKIMKNDGDTIDYRTFENLEQEAYILKLIIQHLMIKERIPVEDIAILAPVKYENSVVSVVDEVKNYKIPFYTIQSFKGLEKSVIILTDIDNYQNDKLLYVGISRAKDKLYVLESINARQQRFQLFFGDV